MTENTENWKCPMCGHENTGRFCCECGAPNPANSKQSAPVSNQTASSNNAVVPPQQAFPTISLNTYPPGTLPARGMMCEPIPPTQPQNTEPWLCTRCDHTNKGGDFCFNCGMPRSKAAAKDEAWICPDCGTQVDKDSPFCPECGKFDPRLTKREIAALMGKDCAEPWKCTQCGFENTSGLYCEKCDASKPSEDKAPSWFDPMVSPQPAFGLAPFPDFIELEQMRRYQNKTLKDDPKTCGCYTCSRIFESTEITTWNGDFAVCPYCESDTVVAKPEKDTDFAELLDKMNRFHIKNERVDTWRKSGYKK